VRWQELRGSRRAVRRIRRESPMPTRTISWKVYPWDVAEWLGRGVGSAMAGIPYRPHVHPELQRIRSGDQSAAFAEVTSATLEYYQLFARRDLDLRLFITEAFEITVPLRRGARLMLDDVTREQLLLIVEGSSIDIPTDEFDPDRTFARSGSPSNLTKGETLDLIRTPPGPGEPLPVSD